MHKKCVSMKSNSGANPSSRVIILTFQLTFLSAISTKPYFMPLT